MSIRLRLTLLYTAILALTLAIFSGMLYSWQWRSLRRAEVQMLSDWARRITMHLQARGMHMMGNDRLLPMPPPMPQEGPRWPRLGAPATYAQLLDASGALLLRSENLGQLRLPLTERGLEVVRRGRFWTEVSMVDDERLLIYSTPMVVNGQVIAIVQVAHSLAVQEQYLRVLGRNLLIGSGLAIVVAFGSGWLLAGAVLRPIDRVTRTAQMIGARRDLSQRVEYKGPYDEIGQLVTTFNAMLAELESAYRQQQQFVADVSHELRTPLTTLYGNLELLRRQPPISDADRAEVLADMTEETKRLIRLVGDLLLLARADARQSLRKEIFPLVVAVEDAVRQAQQLAPERQIRMSTLPDVLIVGDRDAFKQVLLILLDNAIKYALDPIIVSAAYDDQKDASVALRVQDSGPGIDPAVLPRVFERFYRGDTARDKPGFGLGLAIAKALVEAQGGTITVESRLGEGTTFTVVLPYAQ